MPSVYMGVGPLCRTCISKWMVLLMASIFHFHFSIKNYPNVRKDVCLIVQGVGPIVCTIVWTNK